MRADGRGPEDTDRRVRSHRSASGGRVFASIQQAIVMGSTRGHDGVDCSDSNDAEEARRLQNTFWKKSSQYLQWILREGRSNARN